MKRKVSLILRTDTLYTRVLYFLVSALVSLNSNAYQQALNYATALGKPSGDLATVIAEKSQSGLYWFVRRLLDFGFTSYWISVLISFFLLYFLLSRLHIVLRQVGFVGLNTIILTLFIVFTYTFLSPFAYEIQVSGTITQGRLTPVIILSLMSLLFSPSSLRQELKIFTLLILSLSMHPVIGIYLSGFTFLLAVYLRVVLSRILILGGLMITAMLNRIGSASESQNTETLRYLEEFKSEIYTQDFCLHYSNLGSIVTNGNLPSFLWQLSTYIFIGFMAAYQARLLNSHTRQFKIISALYAYSLVLALLLNLLIILQTSLGITALAMMPMRFLDAANILSFPILMYHLVKLVRLNVLIPILSLLVICRVLNARILDFMFKENQVHFIVMLALIFGLSVMKHKGRYSQFFEFDFLKNRKTHLILATFLSTFIAVQINHQISSPGNDWKSLSQLDDIVGFKESKLLTSQEVDFPLALFANYQVLDHGELQSVIYVPESLKYVESKLRTYYGTNLSEYFAQSSCSLKDNSDTRKLWESWEPADWQKLADADGFRFIVVPSDWKLQIKRANLEEITLGSRLFTHVSIYQVY